ncbi:hypothetical protein ACOMHN_063939 [Nucella lapillus]
MKILLPFLFPCVPQQYTSHYSITSQQPGYQEVEENTALTFTCDQYTDTASWVFKAPTTPVINRQDSGYTLPFFAATTRIYSSRGLYSCAGKLGSSSQPGTLVLSPTASDTSNTADRSGRCDVTMSLPVTSGLYSCSVTVNPGNTQTPCGRFTITRPSPPTISCPSDVIPENTLLTCTCNANNIGQPGGRLRWYNGTGSDFSTEVVSANYDVTTLEMTWAVTRGDDGKKFRCVNNWTVKVNAGSDYTASVAWGPDTVSIDGNTSFYTDTIGSKVMTLTCQANEVNPSSALTYNWDVLCDEKQQSNCTFRPRSGPNDPPPSDPQISGYVNGQVLYEGDNLTLTCAVTGGDPQVTSVTLTCQGRSKKKITNGQSSSLEFSSLSSSDHNLTCVCSGQWAMQGYYNLTDSRTLTVNYRTSDTKLTINSENNITVSEKEAVTLTCQSRGRPAPELKLLQRGVELARHNGGQLSLSVERSQLSHNTAARCDNTGMITCHASNGLGSAQTVSVQLYVNCKPRSIIAVPVPPKVNFINKPVTAAFDLEAFPLPDNFTFQYLGSTQKASGSQPVPASIELRAECSNTFADFAVRCIVSVDKAKDSTAEGFYTFTAANAFGEGQFVFQVTLNAPQRPANSGPSGSAYEDVMTEPGRNPQIISGPQPGPSSSGDDTNVYSVEDKSNKAPALPPPPPEAGPSNAGKAKPAAKPKPVKKGKQAKGKDKGKKRKEAEYGNVASSPPRAADKTEGTVYENCGFQGEGNEAAAAAQPAASGGEGSRIPNADGLLYSTVDFTEEQRQKGKHNAPLCDNTDYSGVDFAKMAETARKMSKK